MPRQRFLAQPAPTTSRAVDDWFAGMYKDLRRIAASMKRSSASISTATLVHEAWIKLSSSEGLELESELHFKRTAARVIRQLIITEARRRGAFKRGGGGVAIFVTFDDSAGVPVTSNRDLLRLDAAMEALAAMHPRQAELVQLRFFGGYDVGEAAALLGIAESTAVRDWRVAKAWLAAEIQKESGSAKAAEG